MTVTQINTILIIILTLFGCKVIAILMADAVIPTD